MAVIDLDDWQDSEILTDSERQEVQKLDSRSFGKQGLSQQPEGVHLKLLLEKAISELEEQLSVLTSQKSESEIDDTLFLRLGHYSLLLERFPQALSAYQKYFSLNADDHWKNPAFLYGLGIVYFHYNSFQWAIRAFQHILYADQSFSCIKDVHLLLGLLFKNTRDFDSCRKHFEIAQNDPSQSNLLTSPEIKFHLAHAEELQKNFATAKKGYEELAVLDNVDNKIKGLVFKQLGWLHETVEEFGPDLHSRINRAIEYYQQSLNSYSEDGEVYYYLGRCNAALGDVQQAFGFYRSAIDKRESCPDTWCSIGVLYQQQGQPSDALQAFICAVQLDECHVSAWLNLGILYESEKQSRDAFICYQNASRKSKELGESLKPRLEALRADVMASQQQSSAASGSPNSKGMSVMSGVNMSGGAASMHHASQMQPQRKLHSIDEAWNLPIPAELTSRRRVKNSKRNSETVMTEVGGGLNADAMALADANKRNRPSNTSASRMAFHGTEAIGSSAASVASMEQDNAFRFPPEEFELMSKLEQLNATGNISQSQQMKLMQLQQKFQTFLANQRRIAAAQSSMESMGAAGSGAVGSSGAASVVANNVNTYQPSPCLNPQQQLHNLVPNQTSHSWPHTINGSNVAGDMQRTEMHDSNTGMKTEPITDLTDTLNVLHSMVDRSSKGDAVKNDENFPSTNFDSIDDKSKTSLDLDNNVSAKPSEVPPSIHIHLSEQIIKAVQDYDNGVPGVDQWTIFNMQSPPPLPPEAPECPLKSDVKEATLQSWLHPPTPTVTVESKREAFSEKLMEYCLLQNQPVTVIKGLTTALKIDLSLFTTKSLCEYNPEHPVEVRNQINQPPDENWGGSGGEYQYQCWPCESSRSNSTITKYAHYQVSMFLSHQQEGNVNSSPSSGHRSIGGKLTENGNPASSPDADFGADFNSRKGSTASGSICSPGKGKRGKKPKFKHIKFGTNVDLSDEKKWGPQLHEISKLPIFCRLISAANMLTHLPHTILGMNSVQLYMKVPGCRTPGHQENLNFCSVNINIGPGLCEWFAVDTVYWGAIQRLCERNNTNFLTGSWWPLLDDLAEANIPVFRFIQRPGDLVFINAGVVHWVQSTGFCNNIAWNVGPLNGYQYSLAVERYEWNKLQNYRSLVPMITLTWNLARNVRVTDENLYLGMKACLIKSLKYNELCLEELRTKIRPLVEIRWHGRQHGELVNYCATCDQEVFNILYTKQQVPPPLSGQQDDCSGGSGPAGLVSSTCVSSTSGSGMNSGQQDFNSSRKPQVFVYCRSCALRISANLQQFVILQEYKIEDLTLILNHFKLKMKEPSDHKF